MNQMYTKACLRKHRVMLELIKQLLSEKLLRYGSFFFGIFLFSKYKEESQTIRLACFSKESRGSRLIRSILSGLLKKYLEAEGDKLVEEIEDLLTSKAFEDAKEKLLEITEGKPVIVAIDSLERYSVNNYNMMMAVAALIECSSRFNSKYKYRGIHIKTFISAEIFPFLETEFITNPLKYVRQPVYMHWRPKDLMRLACWRFHSYCEVKGHLKNNVLENIKWSKFEDVLEKVWLPYFGEYVTNGSGIDERTFPYVLRHTQMRPRQMVLLCNSIARFTKAAGTFPNFGSRSKLIVEAIRDVEISLANGVINSYATVFPNITKVLNTLSGCPNVFQANYLDKIAHRTRGEWVQGDYSPSKFVQVLTEMGIVGVVRQWSQDANIIEANFEYAMRDRLPINNNDICVIHPMFYKKFRVSMKEKVIVYPFPDRPEYNLINQVVPV